MLLPLYYYILLLLLYYIIILLLLRLKSDLKSNLWHNNKKKANIKKKILCINISMISLSLDELKLVAKNRGITIKTNLKMTFNTNTQQTKNKNNPF